VVWVVGEGSGWVVRVAVRAGEVVGWEMVVKEAWVQVGVGVVGWVGAWG
jgi:hypothetical protein